MMVPKLNNLQTAFLALGTCLSLVALFVFLLTPQTTASPQSISTPVAATAEAPDAFSEIQLTAKAAVVYDVRRNKFLFEKNPDAQLPLASLTKLMTAIVAQDFLPETAAVPIGSNSSMQSPLKKGEHFGLKELIDYTLVTSSNGGAEALAAAAAAASASREEQMSAEPLGNFVRRMNKKAREIGLSQTYYLGETGLDTNGQVAGGFGSARDMATLMHYLVVNRGDIIAATRYKAMTLSSLEHTSYLAINTNTIAARIPELIASKTGFTDLAGGNLLIAFDAGIEHPIIVAVLGSTEKERFTDTETLVAAALESLHRP